MKIDRTKNASRNILFGLMLKIYQIIIPFLMRTVMIYFMGVQYLGLNSLFTSVLQVLNLAELGVGSAMVYSMYKPIAEDDEILICALLQRYRIYYNIIGGVIAVIGILLIPYLPMLVKGDLPDSVNIYVLYLLSLFAAVISYWMLAYKSSLLQAYQRTDITSKVVLITTTIQYGVQIVTLVLLRNYYMYITVSLVTQILNNIITAVIATRMYPNYKPIGKLPVEKSKEINHRIRDLFTSKIGAVVVNSADTIVISAFLGLTMLAIYQNYFYILNSVIGFVSIIFGSCMAGIGNSIIVESKEKNFNDLKKLTFIISWIAGFCATCLLCLYQPFMDIWVGENLKLEFSVVVCLCIYYFIYEINQMLNTYKDAAGIWHEDRFRPLVTALVNLGMNLVMVQFWGIYGVILSTVLSMLGVGMPWLLYNLFTVLFEKEQLPIYLKRLFFYVGVSSTGCILTYMLCSIVNVNSVINIVLRGGLCCIVPNLFYFVLYWNMPEFKQSIQLANKMTNGKIRILDIIGDKLDDND